MNSINTHARKPRWWLALLLLIFAGVGYIYVGRPRRFLAFCAYCILVALAFYHGVWGWLSHPVVFLLFTAFGLAIFIGFAIDVVVISLRASDYDRPWLNRRNWYVAGLALWGILFILPEMVGAGPTRAIRSFSIPARSMIPALLVGDYVISDTKIYDDSRPERGDIIIFKYPPDTSVHFIKRLVGVPGDKVQLVNGRVVLNGSVLPLKHIEDYENKQGQKIKQYIETLPDGRGYPVLDLIPNSVADNTGVFQVPPGHYFFLGDNRDNSSDSRWLNQMGYVPRENLVAKAKGTIYAHDWARIGKTLD